MNNQKFWWLPSCFLKVVVFQIYLLILTVANGEDLKFNTDSAIQFRMLPSRELMLQIENRSTDDLNVITNIEGLLNTKFLEFPSNGSIQYRDSEKSIVKLNNADWLSIGIFSSQSLTQKQIEEVTTLRSLRIPRNCMILFSINYINAVKISSSKIPKMVLSASEFRIKIRIKIIEGETLKDKEIVSDWISVLENE